MKFIRSLLWAAALGLAPLTAEAAPFTAGDIVVERIGSGTGSLNGNANPVFLEEYSPTGAHVQTIPLPTTVSGSQLALTDSGSATSDGYLNLSGNGQYLTIPGYNAAVGTTSVASAAGIARVVARVDGNGNVDTSTSFTNGLAGNNIRSAYSPDGQTIYASGTASPASGGGVWTLPFGGSSATQVNINTGSPVLTNVRVLEGSGNQLYVSNSTTTAGLNSGINAVGSGFPTTSGNALVNLPGLDNNQTSPTTADSSPYDFFFAKLNPSSPGFDTAYVADDGLTTPALAGGIEKFSLVGSTWVLNNVIGSSADAYRGLTGVVTANGVQLYATRQGGTAQGVVSLTDTSGYDANNNGTPSLIVALPTNEVFRGIDFAPTLGVPEPSSLILGGLGLLGLLLAARRRGANRDCK